jgi:hypothetical protein
LMILPALTKAGDRLKQEFKMSPGKELTVDLSTGGSISITGWDKNLLLVEAIASGTDIENLKIDFDEHSGGMNIDVSPGGWNRHGNVTLEIKVPQQFDLELETMGGEIEIDNIEGKIRGKTMGGDLQLENLQGKLEFTTMGGEVILKNSDLGGEVKTMGGDVLFEDVIGDIKGSTMGGDIVVRNVEKKGNGSEVHISTMGGEIEVDSAPTGADVSTMGGDIHIRSAAKSVKAKTMGGDIDIDAIDGAVTATTMGGDVSITMTGNPGEGNRRVDLSSKGGEITLTVPAGLSMEFDIKLTYTKGARENYKIISDFPINIEESDEWDRTQKYIYGTGQVSGGKNKIKINTINGNIYIKKG